MEGVVDEDGVEEDTGDEGEQQTSSSLKASAQEVEDVVDDVPEDDDPV